MISREDSARFQEGFTLAALMVVLTIISIVIAYTVPTQWSLVLKRDRDRQTIFLMKQYARGILAWQTKHQNPPASLEQLHEAREPRMLRGGDEWINPLTGKEGDWILVPQQAVTPAFPGGPAPQPAGSGFQPQPGIGIGSGQSGAPAPAAGALPTIGGSKLNKELSPPDYKGPFIAVRPRATGKSFIAFNGAEDYSEWIYTVDDLRAEMMMRQAALAQR